MCNKLLQTSLARGSRLYWHWRLPSIAVKKALRMFDCLSEASFKHLGFLREAQGGQATQLEKPRGSCPALILPKYESITQGIYPISLVLRILSSLLFNFFP